MLFLFCVYRRTKFTQPRVTGRIWAVKQTADSQSHVICGMQCPATFVCCSPANQMADMYVRGVCHLFGAPEMPHVDSAFQYCSPLSLLICWSCSLCEWIWYSLIIFKFIQGHWQWCYLIGHMQFSISLPFQLCLYLALFPRYCHMTLNTSLLWVIYHVCTPTPLYQSVYKIRSI